MLGLAIGAVHHLWSLSLLPCQPLFLFSALPDGLPICASFSLFGDVSISSESWGRTGGRTTSFSRGSLQRAHRRAQQGSPLSLWSPSHLLHLIQTKRELRKEKLLAILLSSLRRKHLPCEASCR
eukprot:940325-Rhodomonas_salina.1